MSKSKKMLKRSLALGALMAFVITGQAWAAEVDNNIILSGNSVSFDEKTIQMQNSAVQGIKGYGELKVTDTLTVNSIGNAISAADGDLTISANKVYLTTNNTVNLNNPTNGIVITENQEDLTGKKVLIKDFSVLSIKAHGHGINTCQGDGNTISLIGKEDSTSTVSITARENGVYTYKHNSDYEPERNRIEIHADAVTIDATAYIGDDATYKGYAVIAANKNSTIEIEATGKVDLDGANGAIKAMNGSTVEVTGSTIDIDVNEAFNNRVVGIYAIGNTGDKNDKVIHSTVNVAGPSDIYVKNNSYSQGVRVEDGGVVTLDAVKIYAESVQSEVDGLKAISSHVPNSVGSSIAVSGIAEVEAKGKTWAQGLYSAYSTVAFEKTATITSSTSADGAYSYAVRVLGDTGSNVSSVTFNDSAKLSASGDNAIGIQASGSNPLGIKFENGNVEVTANGSTSARGMSVAYTSGVEAATGTSVVINATSTKGAAYGVLNTYNVDNEKAGANVNLLGNVEIIAKGVDEENSLAIYNKANSAGECGVTTVGGEGKKVVLKGDVVAEGGSVTTTFGAVGSQFDGKVITEGNATTTLNFNAGIWNLTGDSLVTSLGGNNGKLVGTDVTATVTDAFEIAQLEANGVDVVLAKDLTTTTEIISGSAVTAPAITATNDAKITVNAATLNADKVTAEDGTINLGVTNAMNVGEVIANANGVVNVDNGDYAYGATQFSTADNGVINIAGGNVSGVLNVAKGNVNLTAGNVTSTLNIAEDSTVTLTGATYEAENLNDVIKGEGKLVVDGTGVLKTTADQVFTVAEDTKATTGLEDNKVISDRVTYKAGTVSLSDDYSYEYLTSINDAMKAHKYDRVNESNTKLIMTGNLVVESETGVETKPGQSITVDQASGIGSDVHLDKVTVEAEKNLLIGGIATKDNPVKVDGVEATDSVANGFSADSLDLGDADGAIITGGKEVTLGGSDGNQEIVSSTQDSTTLVVGENKNGESGTTGTLNIGTADNAKYTHVGIVHVNKGSDLNTKGETNITEGVELEGGNLNVRDGGSLNANLNVAGESTITGTVNGKLTGQEGAVINVGTDEKTANTSFKEVELKGATLGFDPDWNQNAGQHGVAFASGIDGSVQIARNNYVALGTEDSAAAKAMFEKTELAFGKDAITAALYIKGNQTLTETGSIYVDGSQSTGSFVANPEAGTFSAAANSITMIDADKDKPALSDVTFVTVADGAKLYVDEAQKGETYKVLLGSNINADDVWSDGNILTNNKLIKFEGSATGNEFNVEAKYADVNKVYKGEVIIDKVVDSALNNGGVTSGFINSAVDEKVNANTSAQIDALNSIGAMNEVAGVTHTTYAVSNILTDAVADHMSLANGKEHDKDIWAHYVHTKEDVDGLKYDVHSTKYSAQYNGIVVGTDLYKEGKATVGAALTYVDGNINGSSVATRTENDAKYYGASIYGSIQNNDTAVIADVSYLHGEHDITQRNSGKVITGEPESDAFSVGVRVEKEAKAGIGKLVPYAGLRYMHLGTGNYTNSIGLAYDADDAELFLLPVGLKYSADIKNTNGWTMRPVVEFGYVWAFGDTDADQTVSLNGASNGFGYDVTDSGSYVGRFMLEAEKANISYALGYEYQKGDNVEADKWMVNVNWKF